MTAVLVSVANAVTDALNGASLSQRITAVRSYADWELPLEDSDPSDVLLVDVVPVGMNYGTELASRDTLDYSPAIDVVVRKRLGPDKRQAGGTFTLAEIDELVLFMEEINEYFTAARLATYTEAAWDSEIGTKILAAYIPSHLRQHSQFTGRLRIPFVVQKDF